MLRVALVACVALPAGLARAQAINQVRVGDLPGTNGEWQAGEVVVAVPAAEVQRWFSDARYWSQRFPDDTRVRDLGHTPDGRHVVSFHSAAIGKTLTVYLRERPGLITYDGRGKDVVTHGKIWFQALGPSRTRISMQTTGELHGLSGVFGTENMKRKRALKKLTADLSSAVRLSRSWAAAQRKAG
jgi:hypothetical protein